MSEPANRRPLTSRNSAWASNLASWAVQKGLTPNQISQASMAFAATGLALYWLSTQGPGIAQFLCLLLAAATLQARLVCNLNTIGEWEKRLAGHYRISNIKSKTSSFCYGLVQCIYPRSLPYTASYHLPVFD